MFYFIALSNYGLSSIDHDNPVLKIQSVCMRKFVNPGNSKHIIRFLRNMDLIDIDEDSNNVCQWKGVECNRDGIVNEITWTSMKEAGICSIQWLPPTLETINMKDVRFRISAFYTEKLPRNLRLFRLEKGEVHSTIELRNLPNYLEEFNMESNSLSGTVFLTQLPATILLINMENNSIQKVVVMNSLLPADLRYATFSQTPSKVRFVCLDSKVIDDRIKTKRIFSVSAHDNLTDNDWK